MTPNSGKLIHSFQTEKSNQMFQTYSSDNLVPMYLIIFSNDKLEATKTFYCTYYFK